jgi:hypothetical protein
MDELVCSTSTAVEVVCRVLVDMLAEDDDYDVPARTVL